ncbi:MAG: DUF421 domain-containing protein [Candidatus Limnocylindrales bacterium]|nr:DUF421 domain-containing protein [Candidatus Limnocylindrales bacterium]
MVGEPRLLVHDGRLLTKALREEKVGAEQVRAAVRAQGLARLEDVRVAVLETDGSISVIPIGQVGRGSDGVGDSGSEGAPG